MISNISTLVFEKPSERRLTQRVQINRDRLLDMFAAGEPAPACLLALTAATAHLVPGVRVAVLTGPGAPQTGVEAVFCTQLPSDFGHRLHGTSIDGCLRTTGSAPTTVICNDVMRDPRVLPAWRDACLAHGVLAFHSTPIVDFAGKTIACFLLLFAGVDEADSADIEIVALGRQMTGLILEREHAEKTLRVNASWIAGQSDAFEAAVRGAPLEVSLGILARTAVAQAGAELRCAFYLADHAQMQLHHVVGMGSSYAECVDGFKIASNSLACGLAVYTGRPVITADVNVSPGWQEWLWLAERYGYRACWSFPIETVADHVVGTFAMYFSAPRKATEAELESATRLTHSAAIIIAHYQETQNRLRAEAALQESAPKERAPSPIIDSKRNATARHSSMETSGDVVSRRILIVDDNSDGAQSLAMLLRMAGHETRVASDGLDAITQAEGSPPEIMLIDIGLPNLNGYEVCRRIRAQAWGQSMLLIAITGWGREDDRAQAKMAGFDHHFVKPVDIDVLEAMITAATAGSAAV